MTRATVLRMARHGSRRRGGGGRSAGRSRRPTPTSTCARGRRGGGGRGGADARGAAAPPPEADGRDRLDEVRGHRLPGRRGGAAHHPAARRCCVPSRAQPWPDREAIDMGRYLRAWREPPRLRLGVAHHRPRLPVHLHLVLPRRVRPHPPPARGGGGGGRGGLDRRSATRRNASGTRTTSSPSTARGSLAYAAELSTPRAPPALRVHQPRRPAQPRGRRRLGRDGLLPALARLGERLPAPARPDGAADRGRGGPGGHRHAARHGASRSGCSSCWATRTRTVSDLEATVEHLKRSAPDLFLTTVAYPIQGTEYHTRVAGRLWTRPPLGRAHRPRPAASPAATPGATSTTPPGGWSTRSISTWTGGGAAATGSASPACSSPPGGDAWGCGCTRNEREEQELHSPSGRGWGPTEERARGDAG